VEAKVIFLFLQRRYMKENSLCPMKDYCYVQKYRKVAERKDCPWLNKKERCYRGVIFKKGEMP
jgi:hypothetical protein